MEISVTYSYVVIAEIATAALDTGPVVIPVPLTVGHGGSFPSRASFPGITAFRDVINTVPTGSPVRGY